VFSLHGPKKALTDPGFMLAFHKHIFVLTNLNRLFCAKKNGQTHKHTNRQTHTQTDIQTLVFRVFSAPDFFFFGKYLSIPKSKYIFGKARPGAINPAFQKKKWTKIRRVFGAKILKKKKNTTMPPFISLEFSLRSYNLWKSQVDQSTD
jgi:hypothetical protein